jgi:hypothetical protein
MDMVLKSNDGMEKKSRNYSELENHKNANSYLIIVFIR